MRGCLTRGCLIVVYSGASWHRASFWCVCVCVCTCKHEPHPQATKRHKPTEAIQNATKNAKQHRLLLDPGAPPLHGGRAAALQGVRRADHRRPQRRRRGGGLQPRRRPRRRRAAPARRRPLPRPKRHRRRDEHAADVWIGVRLALPRAHAGHPAVPRRVRRLPRRDRAAAQVRRRVLLQQVAAADVRLVVAQRHPAVQGGVQGGRRLRPARARGAAGGAADRQPGVRAALQGHLDLPAGARTRVLLFGVCSCCL